MSKAGESTTLSGYVLASTAVAEKDKILRMRIGKTKPFLEEEESKKAS